MGFIPLASGQRPVLTIDLRQTKIIVVLHYCASQHISEGTMYESFIVLYCYLPNAERTWKTRRSLNFSPLIGQHSRCIISSGMPEISGKEWTGRSLTRLCHEIQYETQDGLRDISRNQLL